MAKRVRLTNEIKKTRNEKGEKFINEYRIVRLLGRGCSGSVKLCQDTRERSFKCWNENSSSERSIVEVSQNSWDRFSSKRKYKGAGAR